MIRKKCGYSETVNRRRDKTMTTKDKRTNNDLQNTIRKAKDRITRTPQTIAGLNPHSREGSVTVKGQ
jgi:predicted metal-dependent hydrolase